MKLLKERTEIAKAINGHKLPVIRIDLAEADEYGLKSQKVLIDNGTFHDGFPYYLHCELRAYSDESLFKFSQGGTCLSSSFGYSDIEEMLEYRNAPIIETDQDVIVVVVDSKKKLAFHPMILHTEKRIDQFCTTPLAFTDTDYSTDSFLLEAGFSIKEKVHSKSMGR